MNKIIKCLTLGLSLLILAACGSQVSYPNANVSSNPSWELTDYIYQDEFGDYDVVVELYNHSDKTRDFEIVAKAKDSQGNIIGVDESHANAVSYGRTVGVYLIFNDLEQDIADIDYSVSYKDVAGVSIYKDLEVNSYKSGKKVIIEVSNNGNKAVNLLDVHAVFLDSTGAVVMTDWKSIGDIDGEIKPGKTEMIEISSAGEAFEDYKVVLNY